MTAVKPLAAALLALAAFALPATPAAANGYFGAPETQIFTAYGTGNTLCTIQVRKWVDQSGGTFVDGETGCNAALQQTVQASMQAGGGEPAADGPVCSRVGTTCYSDAAIADEEDWIGRGQIHVKLIAPNGQGWVGSPKDCTGIGTDNLTCTFQAYAAWVWYRDY